MLGCNDYLVQGYQEFASIESSVTTKVRFSLLFGSSIRGKNSFDLLIHSV